MQAYYTGKGKQGTRLGTCPLHDVGVGAERVPCNHGYVVIIIIDEAEDLGNMQVSLWNLFQIT